MTNKEKADHKNTPPGMTEKTAEFLSQKQQEQKRESALHQYPKEDKRKDARIEHTNGSTPRRDR